MPIKGVINLPGDKSISHRALMVASLTSGKTYINNLSTGMDVESTKLCLRTCGIQISKIKSTTVVASEKFKSPGIPLDCGNSGTTARLLTGLLVGRKLNAQLIGDKSLSKRPMNRIIEPLNKMGACIQSNNGHLPLIISSSNTDAIDYTMPVASAQVKSSIIFASLGSDRQTVIREKIKTRDHTEIMLKYLGVGISNGKSIRIDPIKNELTPFEITIPGDPSSAAFYAAAAAMIPNSDLTIKNLLANPTRICFFSILEKMGTKISWSNMRNEMGELVGDVHIYSQPLNGLNISDETIPLIIDEIPIIAILATQADSPTIIKGAQELRVKESDRINSICHNLKKMGADIIETNDGFIINPENKLRHAKIITFGDHRIAMAFTIAGLMTNKQNSLDDVNCVDISFPEFFDILRKISK